MNRKLLLYRAIVIFAAMASTIGLYVRSPRYTPGDLSAILLLSVLAVVAELLGFVLPNSARGSIAFIPYLASALTVPTWATVVSVLVVKLLVQAVRRNSLGATFFNLGLGTFTVSSAIWVYEILGGTSLLSAQSPSLLTATLAVGAPALVAVTFSFFANTSIA